MPQILLPKLVATWNSWITTLMHIKRLHLQGRFNYNDGIYRGKYDQYSDCGGSTGYDAYILSAVDIVDPTSKIILVEISSQSAMILPRQPDCGYFLRYTSNQF